MSRIAPGGSPIQLRWDVRAERETLAGLRTLRGRFLTAAVRNAVRKGARPMAKRAKANVPVEFGFTRKSIGTKVKSFRDGNVVAVTGPRRGPKFVYQAAAKPFVARDADGQANRTVIAFAGRPVKRVPANTAHLLELGVKPHRLGSGVQAGRAGGRGRTTDQRGAEHPGFPAKPFLRPAYAQSVGQSKAITAAELKRQIQIQASKMAARDAARAAAGRR